MPAETAAEGRDLLSIEQRRPAVHRTREEPATSVQVAPSPGRGVTRVTARRARLGLAAVPDPVLVLSTLIAGPLAAAATTLAWRAGWLDGTQTYTDVIVGEIAFDDVDKSRDFRAGALLLLLLALLLPVMLRWLPRRSASTAEPVTSASSGTTLLAVAALGGALMTAEAAGGSSRAVWVLTALVVLAAVVAAAMIPVERRAGMDLLLAVLVPLLALLALVSLIVAPTGTPLLDGLRRDLMLRSAGPWLLALLAVPTTIIALTRGLVSRRSLHRAALVLQVPLPLALLATLRGEFVLGGAVLQLGPPVGTRVVFGLASLGLVAAQVRWARGRWDLTPDALPSTVGPVTVGAVTVLATLFTPISSALANEDDFHNGEQFIQWSQLTRFDLSPYDDFYPVPGLIGALAGGVNELLLGGASTTFPVAAGLVRLALVSVAVLSLSAIAGRAWGLAFATVSGLLSSDRVFVPLALLTLLATPRLLSVPWAWLSVWVVGCLTTVSLMPGSGAAATAATVPVAGLMVWRGVRETPWRALVGRTRSRVVATTVVVLLAGASTMLVPYVLDVIRYLRLSGSANTLAYGLGLAQFPYELPLGGLLPHGIGRAGFELVRFSAWWLVLPVLAALAARALARAEDWRRACSPGVVLAVVFVGYLLAVTPYAWGRIDPARLSRPGIFSLSTALFVLPVVLLRLCGPRHGRPLALTAFVGTVLIAMVLVPMRPSAFVAAAVAPTSVPPDNRFYEDSGLAEPRLGDALLSPVRVDELTRTSQVLEGLLTEDETYYDAVNRATLYEVVDRPVPTPFSGEYYAADEATQTLTIERLAQDPPPVVLVATPPVGTDVVTVGPPPVFITSSLRSYRIYRWFLDQGYQPHVEQGVQVLLHPERAPVVDPRDRGRLLAAMFRPPSLKALAVSWGRSWEALAPRFGEGAALTARPGQPAGSTTWQVTADQDQDFLVVDLRCDGADQDAYTPALVRWGDEPHQTLELLVREGRHLIPLASNPDWLERRTTVDLAIHVTPQTACARGSATGQLVELQR